MPTMRWFAALGFALSASCSVDANFDGTNFQCPDGVSCPANQICIEFVCVDDSAATSREFVDDSAADFEAGELRAVSWLGDRLALDAGAATGDYRSRVFDAGRSASWSQLGWGPVAPYKRALPANERAEEGFSDGNVDMQGNILLLSFDDRERYQPGEEAVDASGHGHDAVVLGPDPIEVVDGVVGGAIEDTLESRLEVDAANVADFQFGLGDFTWSLWVQTGVVCSGPSSSSNHAYIGIEDENSGGGRSHLWLGCLRPGQAECDPSGPPNGRPGGTLCAVQGGDCVTYCGLTDLTDSAWHHLVVRKQGHATTTVSLFVDGKLEDRAEGSFTAPIGFDTYGLGVGHFAVADDPSQDSSQGTLDEVAMWRRALGDDEIGSLFRRGALDVRFQVRACAQASCRDNPAFVGPDGTASSFFRDDAGQAAGAVRFDLSELALRGRYFQYSIELEPGGADSEPALFNVSATADL